MFAPLGALSAFGSGAVGGFGTGLDLYDKYTDLQGQALAADMLKQSGLLPGGPGALGMGAGALGGMGMGQPAPGGPGGAPEPSPGETVAGGDMGGVQPGMPSVPPQLAFGGPGAGAGGGLQGGLPIGGGRGPVPAPLTGGATPGAPMVPTTTIRPPGGPATATPSTVGASDMPTGTIGAGEPTGRRPPEPSLPDPIGASRFAQTGQGWLALPDLAKRIEQTNPNASPLAKFKALQAASKMLNAGGQSQFSNTMRLLEFQQRQQQHADTLRQREQTDRRREQAGERAEQRLRQQSPYVQSEKRVRTDLAQQLARAESRSQTLVTHFDKLIEFSRKVSLTGAPKIDTWINDVAANFGSEAAILYAAQLNNLRSEVGSLLGNSPSGVMTEGMRREVADYVLKGVLGPQVLEGLKKLYAWDAQAKKGVFEKQIRQHDKNIDQYMRSGTLPAEEEGDTGGDTGGWK